MSPNVDEHVHVRVSDSISRSPGDQPVVGSRPFEHPAFDEVTEVCREGKRQTEVESEVTAFLHDAVDGLRQCYGAIGGDVPGECLDFVAGSRRRRAGGRFISSTRDGSRMSADDGRDCYRVETDALGLSVAAAGDLLALKDRRTGRRYELGDGPQLTWQVGGTERRFPPTDDVVYEGATEFGTGLGDDSRTVESTDESVSLRVTAREDDWELTRRYTLPREDTRVEIGFALTYRGSGQVRLRETTLSLPLGPFAADSTVEVPGAPIAPRTPFGAVGDDGTVDWEPLRFDANVLGVHDDGTGVAAWTFSWDHPTAFTFEPDGDSLAVEYDLTVAARLETDETVTFEHVCLEPFADDWDAQVDAIRDWWQTVGLETPDERPDWAEGAAFYECHVGSAKFVDGFEYAPYPSAGDLLEDLPRIHELGFDVIQLMPRQPFPSYVYHEYDDVDTYWGDRETIEELVAAAHSRGMRVVLDFVLHGVLDRAVYEATRASMADHDIGKRDGLGVAPYVRQFGTAWESEPEFTDRHPLREQHPEWFMRTDDGDVAHRYTHAFDLANRDLQAYLTEGLRWLVEAVGVDGFRLDAPFWNGFPNWADDLAYPASHAMLGAVEFFRRARREIRADHPETLFYVEAIQPIFRESADLNYSYDQLWLLEAVLDGDRTRFGRRLAGDVTADTVGRWLDERDRVYPAGSRAVHHVDSHDTFWWPDPGKKWFRDRYGTAATEAMVATFGLLDGGYMHYVGAEVGIEETLRTVLHLRRELPELAAGTCDYRGVPADDPMVFTALRTDGDRYSAVAVNFADETVETTLTLPAESLDAERYTVYDPLSTEFLTDGPGGRVFDADALNTVTVRFDPYQSRLLVLRAI